MALFKGAGQEQMMDARTTLEADMRIALEKKQFRLFYQLQVNADGVPVGAEGLIRWRHPQRGMVGPADFIPVAEQSGTVTLIGNWVIQEACRQLKEWSASEHLHQLTLAINVSARQFQQDGFIDSVRRSILETGAAAHRLKLELTETIIHSDIAATAEKIERLRELGVSFALDDFGTGYSSMAYLQGMPIDQIKIDRSFVTHLGRNTKSEAIVRSIIALGRELGLEVIAEGVETPEQKDFLHNSGCNQYQGYLYSVPLSREQFIDRVADLHNQRRRPGNRN